MVDRVLEDQLMQDAVAEVPCSQPRWGAQCQCQGPKPFAWWKRQRVRGWGRGVLCSTDHLAALVPMSDRRPTLLDRRG